MQGIQKHACQLVKCYSKVVDSIAGTQLLAEEVALEQAGNTGLRLLLSRGFSLQLAALKVAQRYWLMRQQSTLPRLTFIMRSTRAARLKVLTPDGGEELHHLPSVALQRDLAASALGCTNPLCTGSAATVGSILPLCAGCRGVRYCR